MTSKVTYLGDLRTSSIHLRSGTELLSDAPIDNKGKGEAFSPTDTIANGLATCMLTTMAIKADPLGIDIRDSIASVTKHMQTEPRKISKIEVVFDMSLSADENTKRFLEEVAHNCPVALSLHPDLIQDVTFNWK